MSLKNAAKSFFGWLTGRDPKESDLYADYGRVEQVTSAIREIARMRVTTAQENVYAAFDSLNQINGLEKYIGTIDYSGFHEMFDAVGKTIDGIASDINDKAEEIKKYEESPLIGKIASSITMSLFKRGEGFVSIIEDVGDGVCSLIGWGANLFGAEKVKKSLDNFIQKEWSHDIFNFYYNSDFANMSIFTEESALANAYKITGKAIGLFATAPLLLQPQTIIGEVKNYQIHKEKIEASKVMNREGLTEEVENGPTVEEKWNHSDYDFEANAVEKEFISNNSTNGEEGSSDASQGTSGGAYQTIANSSSANSNFDGKLGTGSILSTVPEQEYAKDTNTNPLTPTNPLEEKENVFDNKTPTDEKNPSNDTSNKNNIQETNPNNNNNTNNNSNSNSNNNKNQNEKQPSGGTQGGFANAIPGDNSSNLHSGVGFDGNSMEYDSLELEEADNLEILDDISSNSIIDEIIQSNHVRKIPTSQTPVISKKNGSQTSVVPIATGLSVASAAGMGAKAYMDYRKNKEEEDEEDEYEEDDDFEDEEWLKEEDSVTIDATETSRENQQEENFILGEDESYFARNINELAEIQ